ncbi:MAG: fasciclin domain-containing protein [Candidatus Promineifilaceae bacterium]
MKRKTSHRTIFLLITFLALSLLIGAGSVSAQEESTPPQSQTETTQTIYEVIQNEPELASFKALVDAAALSDNLQQDGPFTVFAPTNEAWAAFDVKADTDATMTDILLYHILNGDYSTSELTDKEAVATLAGKYIFFNTAEDGVVLNETVPVTTAEIQATNGVVHIIDTVLPYPEGNTVFASEKGSPNNSIVEVLANDGRFDTLLSLLERADLMGELQDTSASYTLFAPTDEAFEKVPPELLEEWLADPEGALNTILSYQIVNDRLTINQIANAKYLPTLEGRAIAVTTDQFVQVYLNGRPIQSFNILADNGIIHVMDEVILP